MKKAYAKPRLYVESFAVSQTIATACGPTGGVNPDAGMGKPNQGNISSCGWDMGNMVAWASNANKCTIIVPEDANIGGYCYNNPNGGVPIFGSQ